MASVEFLKKKVSGKEKEIAKLEKKLARIQKAKETNWEVNPYYYNEYDLKYTTRDIAKAKEVLEGYKVKLAKEIEKENSRNVKVILDFLNNWRMEVKNYYMNSLSKYLDAREAYYAESKRYTEWFNSRARMEATIEERKEIEKKHRETRKAFEKTWGWITPYVYRNNTLGIDDIDIRKLDKELRQEAKAKYDDIIERTNDIVGTITDASYLSIGNKGDLNGFIVGTKGKASVRTIGAGGYNIQCFHFRTLVREL